MTSVLIADRQELTREGIISVLAAVDGINIIGQAAGASELGELLVDLKPGVLILGHFTVGEIEDLKNKFDLTHVVILANQATKSEIQETLNLGVKNYISKECSRDELVKAVNAAAKGKQFFCESIKRELADSGIQEVADPQSALSVRETEVAHLVAEGLTNKEIAERLFLSIHTVKTHRKNIIKKLGFTFKNAADLISVIGNNNPYLD